MSQAKRCIKKTANLVRIKNTNQSTFPSPPLHSYLRTGGGAPLAKAKSRLGESNTRIGKKRERKIEIVTHSPTWQEPG